MKKIMFNDKYGLTKAVLEGRKTMTRGIIRNLSPFDPRQDWMVRGANENGKVNMAIFHNETYKYSIYPHYKPGEVVAVAQSYKDAEIDPHFLMFQPINGSTYFAEMEIEAMFTGGWNNKMFVRADLMPHQIHITDIKVERLQDISDGDCFKEGIIPITWRQHLPQAIDDLSPQKYIDHNVYTLEKFREGIEDCWAESDPNEYMAEDAKTAFAVLIFKTLGRKVWERNPYVFAYTFELVK